MAATRIALCLLVFTAYRTHADVDIITEPRPGEEFVLVSSGQQTPLRQFESSHKIPEKHPHHRVVDDGNDKIIKKLHSGKGKHPTEGIVAIEEDKKSSFRKRQKGKISDSIEIDIPVSKLEDIKIKENVKDVETNPEMAVALEAMSESGKLSNKAATTTQKPVLTTAPTSSTKGFDYIPINFDSIDDINSGLLSSNVQLETAGSEQKQHSRIQIKKGPNGQDYEYEYVYYYYDEDSKKDAKDSQEKGSSTTAAPVHNSHDGPQKAKAENQITKDNKAKSKYSTIDRSGATTTATPENLNEVLPTSRTRQRGRTVAPAPVEEIIEEDRLPSSTRFPPRGRNLSASSSTTYVPEVSSESVKHRRPHQPDNVADESIGQTRSRTRTHVRRPSSELVDLDSFKTHPGDIPLQYKEPPTRYSSESKTTTESPEISTTIKESSYSKDSHREGHALLGNIKFQEIFDDSKLPPDYKHTTPAEQDTTEYTTMAAMEKVALDLYAYLARENLNNEVNDPMDFDGSTTVENEAYTTEAMSTTEEATTPATTTTTTTTTTTPAPTTTAAPAPSTRPSRFRGRPGVRSRASPASTLATEAPQETSTKTRGRFGKPSGARKTTAATAVETSTSSTADKPVTKQAFGRRGLFAGRTRPSSTTAAPAQDPNNPSQSDSSPPVTRPRLRPALRRTTAASSAAPTPVEDSTAAGSSSEPAETTPTPLRPSTRSRPGLRPAAALRPGARLNLRPSPRLRPGQAAPNAEPAPDAAAPDTPAPEPATESEGESSASTATPEQPARGGIKIRGRLQVNPSPKPRVTVTQPPRRPNPLLKRKLPSTEVPTEAPKKTASETTEESVSEEKEDLETEAPAETTPAAPLRGLDALFARRRAAAAARLARPARSPRAHS